MLRFGFVWSAVVLSRRLVATWNSPSFTRAYVPGLLVMLTMGCGATVATADEPSVATVRDAWTRRLAMYKGVEAKWNGVRYAAASKYGNKAETSFPFSATIQFDLPGRRLRLDYRGKEWSDRGERWLPQEEVYVCKGNESYTLFREGTLPFPNAHLREGGIEMILNDFRLTPLVLWLLPFDPLCNAVTAESLEMTGRTGVSEGMTCNILTCRQGELWVSGRPEFVPVKYLERRRGRNICEVTLQYRSLPDGTRYPSGWNVVSFGASGGVSNSWSAVVSDYVQREQFDESVFATDEKAPGTWIHDYRKNEETLIMPDGSERLIKPGDFNGTNYDELLHGSWPSRWFYRVMWVLALCAAGGICVIVWRRQRLLRGPNRP